MKNVILSTIKKYNLFKENDVVIVAVSGGADSMALLHVLLQIKEIYSLQLVIAHVNHKKRINSELDEALVKQTGEQFKIPYEIYYLPKNDKVENFHDYARRKRYEFFNEVAKKYNGTCVVTAHHADDQLETQIHRFLYQSNPAGLIGIEPKIKNGPLKLVRPLIEVTKEAIYDYCMEMNVKYREDESNESNKYTRNRIRHFIVPPLVSETSSVYKHAREISEQLSDDEAYFSTVVQDLMKEVQVVQNEYHLSRQFINNLPKSLSRRLMKTILQKFSDKDIQTHHIFDILDLIASQKPNLCLTLPHDMKCIISYDKVLITTKNQGVEPYEIVLNRIDTFNLPNNKTLQLSVNKVDEKTENFCINKVHLCYNEIELPLKVRTRKPGDRIQLINGHGSKKIKEIMIEEKVPKALRECWPIVVDAFDQIIWVPGLKKSAYCLNQLKGNIITLDYKTSEGIEDA